MTLRGEKLEKPTYAILRSLRGGKVSDAYLAHHEIFGGWFVQKTYSILGMEDAAAYQEPRILNQTRHEHVVEVREAQYDPEVSDAITFVMKYCEGGSVANRLDDDYRFSIGQALRLTTHVLEALAHVHTDADLRFIHRDVKPGNVMLSRDYRTAYLGDFGSAALMERDSTVAGIEGSPLYAPPEGGPPTGRVGVAGDIYGAGMTLFEMLNGPFPYAAIEPEKVDRRLTRGHRALPESAFEFAPHIPEQLRSVVRKALRVGPSERYESCSAFIRRVGQLRCLDWRHVEGEGLDGRWEGTWPPSVPEERRRRYRVISRILAAGPERGKRRLEAFQASSPTGGFSRFEVPDATVDPEDRKAIDRFFAAVAARAAHLAPAR